MWTEYNPRMKLSDILDTILNMPGLGNSPSKG
jgi:hypothetical protein